MSENDVKACPACRSTIDSGAWKCASCQNTIGWRAWMPGLVPILSLTVAILAIWPQFSQSIWPARGAALGAAEYSKNEGSIIASLVNLGDVKLSVYEHMSCQPYGEKTSVFEDFYFVSELPVVLESGAKKSIAFKFHSFNSTSISSSIAESLKLSPDGIYCDLNISDVYGPLPENNRLFITLTVGDEGQIRAYLTPDAVF